MKKNSVSDPFARLEDRMSVLLIAVLGLIFAQHLWNSLAIVFHSPSSALLAHASPTAHPQGDAIGDIIKANLFKGMDDANSAPGSNAMMASSLQLIGTFAGSNGTASYALIGQAGQKEQLYKEGDQIGGNLKIDQITADHVVLNTGQSQVTLYLKYP